MIGLTILLGGLLYVALGVWIAQRVTKPIGSLFTRVTAFIPVMFLLILVPFVDGIWGYQKLQTFCAAESRTEVSGKVQMPLTLLDSKFQPLARDQFGNIDWGAMRPYLEMRSSYSTVHSWPATIERTTRTIVRVSDRAEIARQTNFFYRGGWIRTNSEGIGASSCVAKPSIDSIFPELVLH